MSLALGTNIFWITFAAVPVILLVASIIGQVISAFFPYLQRPLLRFYLSPSLGLAFMLVMSSVFGRYYTVGSLSVILFFLLFLILVKLIYQKRIINVLAHALTVGVFGLVCGISVFVPLYLFGGFNSHNDAFTYLEHSNWLQHHAFHYLIAPDAVTPSNTQIYLYQIGGYRMGASFLLALFQSVSKLPWSYDIYPSANISSIAACCLGVGLVIHKELSRLRKYSRFLLLALPALGYGSLVFAANTGFLPQMYGLTFASGILFLVGLFYKKISNRDTVPAISIVKITIPVSLLLAGVVYSYSEISPFIILAILVSGLIMGIRLKTYRDLTLFFIVLFILTAILLNTEVVRAYSAIRAQANAVVGGPVTWPWIGFLAHALGVHGGTFGDVYQWSIDGSMSLHYFRVSILLVIFMTIWSFWRLDYIKNGLLLPTIVILLLFICAFIYFRYVVASPFPVGYGQSWSQFKLSEWAHPFFMALLLGKISSLGSRTKLFGAVLIMIVIAGMNLSGQRSIIRMNPVTSYYMGVRNLSAYYQEIRRVACEVSPGNDEPIYLELNGDNHKFRQMMTLYLCDRTLYSDWTDDGYIYPNLPNEKKRTDFEFGNCVIEPISFKSELKKAHKVGGFKVGIMNNIKQFVLSEAKATYGRETDGENWWYWVDHQISFNIRPHEVYKTVSSVEIEFEYSVRGKKGLIVIVDKINKKTDKYRVKPSGDGLCRFSRILNIAPLDISTIKIEAEDAPTVLGNGDQRMAAFMIRNVIVRPVLVPSHRDASYL